MVPHSRWRRRQLPVAAATETVIHNFGVTVGDGADPNAGLLITKTGALWDDCRRHGSGIRLISPGFTGRPME